MPHPRGIHCHPPIGTVTVINRWSPGPPGSSRTKPRTLLSVRWQSKSLLCIAFSASEKNDAGVSLREMRIATWASRHADVVGRVAPEAHVHGAVGHVAVQALATSDPARRILCFSAKSVGWTGTGGQGGSCRGGEAPKSSVKNGFQVSEGAAGSQCLTVSNFPKSDMSSILWTNTPVQHVWTQEDGPWEFYGNSHGYVDGTTGLV